MNLLCLNFNCEKFYRRIFYSSKWNPYVQGFLQSFWKFFVLEVVPWFFYTFENSQHPFWISSRFVKLRYSSEKMKIRWINTGMLASDVWRSTVWLKEHRVSFGQPRVTECQSGMYYFHLVWVEFIIDGIWSKWISPSKFR